MKALVGLILFIAVVILCTFFSKPLYKERIERDLGQKVGEILTDHSLDPSGVVIENHHLIKIGEQPATASKGVELLNELDEVIGLYVDEGLIVTEVSTPPSFQLAEQSDQSVILKGLVKDESERAFLVELASRPAKEGGNLREVVDQLEVRQDVSKIDAKEKIAVFVPGLLLTAAEASLAWSPTKLEVGGILDHENQETELLTSAAELSPQESSPVSELKVQAPQELDFGLVRRNRKITVTGLLADENTRDRLLTLVRRESRGSHIVNETTLAVRPKESWWADSPEVLLPALFSTTTGTAKIHYYHDRFVAEATFDERADYDVVKAAMAEFPEETERATDLRIVRKAPPAPRPVRPNNPIKAEALISKLKDFAVYFGSSSAVINKTEDQKIIEAAKLILSSKDVTQGLTVGGYADLRGNASFNRDLSLKRANAVKEQLIAKGVPASRLTVKHFGEDTSRTSKKNLWKSRRVEISLTETSDQKTSDQ